MKETSEKEQISERIGFMAKKMEENISGGGEVFVGEVDRLWLKQLVEREGRDLSIVRGAANISEQAEDLVKFYSDKLGRVHGCNEVSSIINSVICSLIETKSGRVFDKEEDEVMGLAEELDHIGYFIDGVFEEFHGRQFKIVSPPYDKDSSNGKILHRIEAVMAVTNKLLWILAAESEGEGVRRQGTNGVLKHVRERVLRGLEKEGGGVPTETKRLPHKEVIRHLPKGGLRAILEDLSWR